MPSQPIAMLTSSGFELIVCVEPMLIDWRYVRSTLSALIRLARRVEGDREK
jgi:hypothetical protein